MLEIKRNDTMEEAREWLLLVNAVLILGYIIYATIKDRRKKKTSSDCKYIKDLTGKYVDLLIENEKLKEDMETMEQNDDRRNISILQDKKFH